LRIDYKAVDVLRRFVSEEGKIRPRRQTGTCANHQRQLAKAIKNARHMALLPFVGEVLR
jgi:small subunit ribosomal protein S18